MSNELEFNLELETARVDAKPEPCVNGLGQTPPNKMLQGGNDDKNAKKALADKQEAEREDKPIV